MVDKKELAFFKRYLKDKGLYAQFKHACVITSRFFKDSITLKSYLSVRDTSREILMYCVSWDIVRAETGIYWGDIYRDYKKHFVNCYKNYKNGKNN